MLQPQLANKRIVLGLTGGIACYKLAEFIRRAREEGTVIDVVMTQAATRFMTPMTMQALSDRPVWLDLWDDRASNSMAHINLTRGADAVLIAPATADFIGKLVHGLADDLLSTLCMARGSCPLLVAPAMNREMWQHPATQRNIAQLQHDGAALLGPATGDQACGEYGGGRMLEPEELLEELIAYFQPKHLAGKHVVLTAGPTSEAIDPVRVLTNRSSGKMGYALARAAREAGAQVTLISGPTALPAPYGVRRIDVSTALEMHAAVMGHVQDADAFIAVAAVADWRIANVSAQKLKKTSSGQSPRLDFVANPDILADVAALEDPPFCVGFAAETENLLDHAQDKRRRKNVPLLVGNLVQNAMERDTTELVLITAQGHDHLPAQPKRDAARTLISHIARHMGVFALPPNPLPDDPDAPTY